MIQVGDSRVKCKYCEEEFSSRGIYNHEKHCEMNPENREKKFKTIIPNKTISLKIYGIYYSFKKGEKVEVENEVAEILKEVNLCIEEGE